MNVVFTKIGCKQKKELRRMKTGTSYASKNQAISKSENLSTMSNQEERPQVDLGNYVEKLKIQISAKAPSYFSFIFLCIAM